MHQKRYLLLLLSLVLSRSLFSQTLIAYYPFDNHTADFSGYNNDGKFYGGLSTTADRFGNPCGAVHFNGRDAYVSVPSSASLKSPVKNITVSCWFKLDSPAIQKDKKWLTLICKGKDFEESYYNPQYRVQVYQSPIQSTISINTDFTEYDTNYVKNSFSYGWNFFVLVYDGKSIQTYLNNVQTWEFPYSKTFTPNDDPLFIGKDIPGNMEHFAGSLDDLRIYNGALSVSEINRLYNESAFTVTDENIDILCPHDIVVNNEPGKCFAKVNFNKAAVNYDCGNATVKQTGGLTPGSNFPIGVSNIIFETKSKTGLKRICNTTVTVTDNEAPVFLCKADTFLMLNNPGTKGMIYNYTLPKAFDNCSSVSISMLEGLPPGSLFPEGQTVMRFIATDANGNKSECSYSVFVADKTAKTFTESVGCMPDIKKTNEQGKCGAIVTYSIPANKTGYVLYDGIASGRFFPVGTTVNKYRKSYANNVVECSFNIIVTDVQAPVFVCPQDQVIYCKANETSVPFFYETPEVKDNCGIESVQMTQGFESGSRLPLGTTTISHKAIDYSGNSSECSFTITVKDTSKAVIDKHEKTETKTYLADKVKYDHDLKFKQCLLTLYLYDDGEEDNDTVSVFFNGVEIVNREMIKLKSHGMIIRTVALIPGENNDFIVKAWNNGSISPNTIKIEFHEGGNTDNFLRRKKASKIRVLHSKPGVAGAISIRCNGR